MSELIQDITLIACGAFLAKFLEFLSDRRNSTIKRQSLETALKTEVVFLSNVIARRGLANILDRALADMESGRVQSYDQPILGLVSVWREHEPIYTANIDKIGMLSKRDASRIVTFHEILNLVKKDQLTLPKYSPEAQKIALRLHAEWLRAACELGEIIGNEAKIDVSLDVVRMRKPADETLG